jgi:hypothetical protein
MDWSFYFQRNSIDLETKLRWPDLTHRSSQSWANLDANDAGHCNWIGIVFSFQDWPLLILDLTYSKGISG